MCDPDNGPHDWELMTAQRSRSEPLGATGHLGTDTRCVCVCTAVRPRSHAVESEQLWDAFYVRDADGAHSVDLELILALLFAAQR